MNQVIPQTAFAAAPVISTGVFAGPATTRPVTGFALMGTGPRPVDIVTAVHAATGADRHGQSVAVRDEQANVSAGVSCTLANDQGSWPVQAGGTITVRRSADDLRTTCAKDGQVIASAVVSSAQPQVPVATGPFGSEVVATISTYPTAFVFTSASTAAATATSPLAQH